MGNLLPWPAHPATLIPTRRAGARWSFLAENCYSIWRKVAKKCGLAGKRGITRPRGFPRADYRLRREPRLHFTLTEVNDLPVRKRRCLRCCVRRDFQVRHKDGLGIEKGLTDAHSHPSVLQEDYSASGSSDLYLAAVSLISSAVLHADTFRSRYHNRRPARVNPQLREGRPVSIFRQFRTKSGFCRIST